MLVMVTEQYECVLSTTDSLLKHGFSFVKSYTEVYGSKQEAGVLWGQGELQEGAQLLLQ